MLSLLTSKSNSFALGECNPQINYNQVNFILFCKKIIKKKFETSKVLNEFFFIKKMWVEKSQILTHPTRVCTKDIPFIITTLCLSLKFPIGFFYSCVINPSRMIDDAFELCLWVQGFLGNELFHEHAMFHVCSFSFLCTID
jgi:hypothetical protein